MLKTIQIMRKKHIQDQWKLPLKKDFVTIIKILNAKKYEKYGAFKIQMVA